VAGEAVDVFWRDAKAVHAGINFQMNADRAFAEFTAGRGGF